MRLNVATRIISGFVIVLALFIIHGIILLLNINNTNKQFEFVVEHDASAIANAQELRKLMVDMETGQRGFIITQKDEFLEPYIRGYKKFNKLMLTEKELVSDNPSQVMALEKIEALVDKWNETGSAARDYNGKEGLP